MLRPPFVRFDEHEKFPKDFGEVAPVNFVNDEKPIPIWVIPSPLGKMMEYSIPAF